MVAGLVAVMEVAELTANEVAAVEPNITAVAPVNPVPVMVTVVPPESRPVAGLIAVTVGAGAVVAMPSTVKVEPLAT